MFKPCNLECFDLFTIINVLIYIPSYFYSDHSALPYICVKKLFKTSISLLFSGLLNLNDDKSVIESVQTMLLPGIERRVAAKKRLEDLAISTLVENVTLLQQSNLPSDSDFQTASESENLSSQEPQPSCSSSHNAE